MKQFCRSCGAPVWWGITPAGHKCPFDIVNEQVTTQSHFVTCPDRRGWTRARRKAHVPADGQLALSAPPPSVTSRRLCDGHRCRSCARTMKHVVMGACYWPPEKVCYTCQVLGAEA